jgi:hypothetical protein
MPINLHGDYEFTENDEVEDLYELLCDVKLQFPDVEGFCWAFIKLIFVHILNI